MTVFKKIDSAKITFPKPVGYFGPEGSFSHEVAEIMLSDQKLVPFAPTGTGFRMLQAGELSAIVVPFENSIGGAVPETLDHLLLVENRNKRPVILEQWVFQVNLCLMGQERVSFRNIKRIYTHFVPLQVIRPWLEKKFPSVETVLTSSTSAAARECMRDKQALAVANKGAAQVYRLKIFEDRLAPPNKNITRFLLVGDKQALLPTFYNKTGLVRGMLHLRLVNRSGALCDALLVFKKHGVNLTQILSRPVAGSPGSHQFLIEWEGASKETTMPWLKELRDVTRTCSSLGIYKVRDVPSATLKKATA